MSPIDTAKERRQAEGSQEPAPDGAIDAQDRATAAGEYPTGIQGAGGGTTPEVASPVVIFRSRMR